MNRGDRRQAIFGDDEDRQRLLQPQELAFDPRRSMPPGNMTISLTGTFMDIMHRFLSDRRRAKLVA